MKTLDEVIKAWEICHSDVGDCDECPYCEKCDNTMNADVLDYLKEYRERKETLRYWSEKAISEQQNLADAYMLYTIASEKENSPLAWDDLFRLEMIGKPVWSEVNKRGWMLLIDSALDNRSWVDLVDASGKQVRLGPHDLEKYQLYRKEEK